MAGWIALRSLSDPTIAFAHFQHVDDGSTNPVVLARAGYWRGRAAEATGRVEEARANYTAAARYSTAYYGQLARARLGLGDLALREPVRADQVDGNHTAAVEVVRAAALLYSLGERDLAVRFVAALAEQSEDATALAALAEVTVDNEDPQATLLIGKGALARGLPLDPYAFSTAGLPPYKPMGPEIDPSIVYAVMRTERVRSAGRFARERGGTHAGHAGSGSRYREPVRTSLRLDPPHLRSRLQHPNGGGRARGLDARLPRLPCLDLCRLQCGAWPGGEMDRAIRRSA